MTKIISISDEAYEQLAKHKGTESFTKTILRLLESKPLSSYAGTWKDPELDRIFNDIAKERHKNIERTW